MSTSMQPTTSLTLAHKLGQMEHVSGLLRRIAHASGANDQVGDWLLKVAVERGATHYHRDFAPGLPPDSAAITDEEIGVALCLGEHSYNATYLRAVAQLLSSARIDRERLLRLAIRERCETVLLHVATVAARFAPELEPWNYLRAKFTSLPVLPPGLLPHWSRFVSHTDVTPYGGGPNTEWLARHEQPLHLTQPSH